MLSDIEKHSNQDPKIAKCDVIVVAGDLVSGAEIGDPSAHDILRQQYKQAKDLLTSLSSELIAGDLRRIFIVPGNHDVCWHASKASMEKVDGVNGPDAWKLLTEPNSQYRWCWSDLSLYHIKTVDEYDQRLLDFKAFFDDFYQTIGLTFNLQSHRQALNFVLPDGRALFSGFSSLAENDCFKLHGVISIDDLAANNLAVRRSSMNDIPLKIAFWHHGVEVIGYNEDHLNSPEVLPQLIDRGYALGLHGHQHRSAVVSYAFSLNPKLVMPIVASGSLCAGPFDIPTGHRRQYNVIEIDSENSRARVQVREWFENAIWAAARVQEFGGKSYFDVELPILTASIRQAKTTISVSVSEVIGKAEAALKARQYTRVRELLAGIPRTIPLVRKLLMEALQEKGQWDELIDLIGRPDDTDELALVVNALSKKGNFDKARQILSECSEAPEKYDRSLINNLVRRLNALEGENKWRKE